jgi:hypothetical protein
MRQRPVQQWLSHLKLSIRDEVPKLKKENVLPDQSYRVSQGTMVDECRTMAVL